MTTRLTPPARRWWAAAAGAVLLAGVLPAQATAAPEPAPAGGPGAAAPGTEERTNYDSRSAIRQPPSAGVAKRAAAAEAPGGAARKLRAALGVQGIVDIDEATGTPRRVARLDGFLTSAADAEPETVAREYVKANAGVFGLSAAAVDGLTLRKDYVDVAGTHHLSFVQTVDGVPVFGNGLKAHVAKDGRLIQVDGSPLAALPAQPGTAKLTAAKARAAAITDVAAESTAAVARVSSGATRTTTFTDGGNAKLVLFQTVAGPRLAWQTVAMDAGYLHVVDAADGTVLLRQSIRSDNSAKVFPNYPGAAGPGGVQQDVNLTRWLPANSPRLAGNVAHVWSDVNDDNKANPGEEVAPSGPRSFDYPFTDFTAQAAETGCTAAFKCSWDPKVAKSWEVNRAQNAVQLYYFLGTFHDHLRKSPIGFTREAGNFEAVDGDAVQGHAMDGANTGTGAFAGLPDPDHVDNANMNTPPDGTPPVMQMYLFHDPSTPTDPFIAGNSGDEAGIVYHEYGHGLSNRLVVDAAGVSTLGGLQAGAMGEAWSDWYAMDLLVNQGHEQDTDAVGDVLVGKYVTAGGTIRSAAMDCTVGADSPACPGGAATGPGGYTYGDYGQVSGAPQVHADGEIWSQTLWDLRKVIGSKKAQSLITRAMELSPSNPSFLDMRNSILQADLVVNGGKQQARIWKVFAARGMGYFAGSVNGDDTRPVEDFALPPAANTPRGSLTGTVVNADTGTPIGGAVVGFGGHASGFGGDYVATTAADGTYTISGIIAGTYPKVFARGPGYDTVSQTVTVASRVNTANWAVRRDWAAVGGGASVTDFNGVDFTPDGCGPVNLIDQSQGAGWVSDAEGTGDGEDTTAIEPRFVVVKLPAAIDVAELSINPSTACGLAGSSSTGDFKVETSADGTTWRLGAEGHFGPTQRSPQNVALAAGSATDVQFVRYWMLGTQTADIGGFCPGNYNGCTYVATSELALYGTAAS